MTIPVVGAPYLSTHALWNQDAQYDAWLCRIAEDAAVVYHRGLQDMYCV